MAPSLSIPTNLFSTSQPNKRSKFISAVSSPTTGRSLVTEAKNGDTSFEGTKERIKNLFDKVELSVSSYDTAWTAMVPSPSSPEVPCFPECIKWLLSNQLQNGSWGLPHQIHPALTKDTVSSTLACVLALKRWGVGEQNIVNGLQFIENNFATITDKNQQELIGFDITFPGMIEHARDLNLNLPLRPTDVDAMLRRRDLELQSANGSDSKGLKAYLAYVSEGLGKSQDWASVVKYQRRNGSLFNSPSTTAAALAHFPNDGCLHYLRSLVDMSGDAVPAIYPLHLYSRLHMVDTVGRLGIKHHFRNEIASVLDETYRCWLLGDEEIFLDTATCAMAFRLLRDYGYEVSSDPLAKFAEESHFFNNTLEGYMKDTSAVLELNKASHMIIYPEESYLDQIQSWTSCFLKQESSSGSIQANNKLNKYLSQEVDYDLMYPSYSNMERLATGSNIQHYNSNGTRALKTSYCSPNIGNKDFLKLAVEDFNINRSIYLEEFEEFERWVVEQRLDKVWYLKYKIGYSYYAAAANLAPPELSEARLTWAKHALLACVCDDWFDRPGYWEDKSNLVALVEKWDVNAGTDGCSEEVEILFYALHSAISESGKKAYEAYGCDATHHVKKQWLGVIGNMLKEAEWVRSGYMPTTMDEYFAAASWSVALSQVVFPPLLFVGEKITEEILEDPEVYHLAYLMSSSARLLNDTRTHEREVQEGKLATGVSLRVLHSNGAMTEEEAIEDMNRLVVETRRELLRRVLEKSLVPRACKDVIWDMNKVVELVYMESDGLHVKGPLKDLTAFVHEPFVLHQDP